MLVFHVFFTAYAIYMHTPFNHSAYSDICDETPGFQLYLFSLPLLIFVVLCVYVYDYASLHITDYERCKGLRSRR